MIAAICGNVIERNPFVVYLNVSGIVYEVYTPLNVQEEIENIQSNEEIFLFTRVIYKEDDQIMYGFLHKEEKELFDFLRKLRGIGPAISMGIISTLGAEKAFNALISEKVGVFIKVPKIGKVKATTMLFEAKKKYKRLKLLAESLRLSTETIGKTTVMLDKKNTFIDDTDFEDLLGASLISLGFSEKEVEQAKEKLDCLDKKLPPKEEKYISFWIKELLQMI